jgi:hypothetical protein
MTIITIVTNADRAQDKAYCTSFLSGDDVEKIKSLIEEVIQQSDERRRE